MPYLDIDLMRRNTDLLGRIAAAVSQENNNGVVEKGQEYTWVVTYAFDICSSPGWDASWASGRALRSQEEIPEGEETQYLPIGQDAGVITDGNILAVVQPFMVSPELPPEEPPEA